MFRHPLVVVYLSLFLGGGSLFVFLLFLFAGSFNLVDLGLDRVSLLCFDAGLAALFFVQHSAMVRHSFRKRFCRQIPPEYVNACYSMASGIILGFVMVLWQRSGDFVLVADGVWRGLLRLLYFGSAAGFFWGARALGAFDPFGTRLILDKLRGRQPEPIPFAAKGPYQWVRHPLYLCMLLMIWSCPDLSVDRLLFNLLWSGWIWVGCRLEEKDLLVEFGQTYRDYQARVPMLIPRIIPLRDH